MSLVVGLTPGKSLGYHTEDQTYALKLTRRRVQSTLHRLNPNYPKWFNLLQTIVHKMISKCSELKTAE
jgi:hypothetical protein